MNRANRHPDDNDWVIFFALCAYTAFMGVAAIAAIVGAML